VRGLAVIFAASSAWVVVTGRMPPLRMRVRVQWRSVVLGVLSGILVTGVMYGLLATIFPSVAIGLLSSSFPMIASGVRDRAAMRERMELWPDALAHMRSSIGAGMTLPDAVIDACQRVGGDLGSFAKEVRRQVAFGEGFPAALRTMREELDDPVTDRVVATLAVAQQVGGHRVGDVLRSLQASVADDLRLRRAHDAAMTEQRWTAGVALIAPWALLVLSITTNDQAGSSFDTAEGAVVVGLGFTATSAGWYLARRSARLSQPPRLFL